MNFSSPPTPPGPRTAAPKNKRATKAPRPLFVETFDLAEVKKELWLLTRLQGQYTQDFVAQRRLEEVRRKMDRERYAADRKALGDEIANLTRSTLISDFATGFVALSVIVLAVKVFA